MPETEASQVRGGVDAELFMSLSESLKRTHQRVVRAPVAPERRARWHRRLIAIANAAKRDLVKASEQLSRFTAELDRQLGAEAGAAS